MGAGHLDKHLIASIQLIAVMAKWLTSLVLIAALGGSALSGMPLHASERACNMAGMMDCCAVARAQDDVPEVSAARLCCTINCPQPGTTPTNSFQRSAPLLVIALHPATIQPPLAVPGSRLYSNSSQNYLHNSQPTYIRHLALLI